MNTVYLSVYLDIFKFFISFQHTYLMCILLDLYQLFYFSAILNGNF